MCNFKATSPKALATCMLALTGQLLAMSLQGQQCTVSAVLDQERAYFGSTLSHNTCSIPGAVCEKVFFFSEQRQATAECKAGRWAMREDSEDASSCPRFVFGDGEVWNNGSYQPNSCDATTAPLCTNTYFYDLPQGGSDYRTAACKAGEWRPEEPVQGQGPFRLRRAQSATELAAHLKEGLKSTYSDLSGFHYGPPVTGGPSGGPSGGNGPSNDGIDLPLSGTNIQEAGVDEEDRVKSDGSTLYILQNGQTLRGSGPSVSGMNVIRILDIDPQSLSAEPIGNFEVELNGHQIANGLYLRGDADQVVLTANDLYLGWAHWYSPLAWLSARSSIVSIDVTDPEQPVQDATLELTGTILSSRRIGDVLYVATRFQPYLQGLGFYDPDSLDAARHIERIDSASLSDLLPSYRRDANSAPRLLTNPWDCYIPAAGAPVRTADVVSLFAVDLDTMEIASSKCFVGSTETLYMSPESVYLASTRHEYELMLGPQGAPVIEYTRPKVETDVHKFSLDGGAIAYEASASVDGHLGWDILKKPFRMSERGSDLRVITYTDELTADKSPVALTVLRDTGEDELEVIGRLPNSRRPAPIGKPGEELYATRFLGDRAYLVTFLITDPLYVIDLSKPEDPLVAGELEITGYSDYLHPLPDGYLLGVGKDAIPDPSGGFRGAWYQGVKVSLYDVSDPKSPFEADSWIIGKRGSETDVLGNHRAFTHLAPNGSNPRVAMGTRVHDRMPPWSANAPSTFFDWSYSGLHLFEVDTRAGKILPQGEMRVEVFDPPPGSSKLYPIYGDDRSVLAGDAVFYVHGDDVYTALWSNPWLFTGPK